MELSDLLSCPIFLFNVLFHLFPSLCANSGAIFKGVSLSAYLAARISYSTLNGNNNNILRRSSLDDKKSNDSRKEQEKLVTDSYRLGGPEKKKQNPGKSPRHNFPSNPLHFLEGGQKQSLEILTNFFTVEIGLVWFSSIDKENWLASIRKKPFLNSWGVGVF